MTAGTGGGGPDAAALKAELRRRVLARRDALSASERRTLSAAILARVTALDAFRAAGTVLAYCGFGSELETGPLLGAVLDSARVLLLPRVDRGSRTLALHRVRDPEAELRPGTWGIREPDPARCPVARLEDAGFVLVPGVAFDAHGGRVGYGGGYYDRLLAASTTRPLLVAGAYELQLLPEVPVGPGDRRVDLVVTERGLYRASPAGPG